jgi:periplasmic protein TonB
MTRWVLSACTAILLVIVVMPPQATAEDSLSTARDLYSAAEYGSALQLLNRLRMGEWPADQTRAIEQYRAFCLLALGRSAEAEQAIAAVVAAEPLFRPSDAEASPRVRSAFSEVRRKMWPSLVQQRYTTAKADYDRKDFTKAAEAFRLVLEMLADPVSGDPASSPQLADVRTLAGEFRELSLARTMPAPVAPAALAGSALQSVAPLPTASSPQPKAPPPGPPAPVSPTVSVAAKPKTIFSPANADVVPPSAIKQVLPPFPAQIGAPAQGLLELVIDESGSVESVTMKVSVNPYYDRSALQAARSWKYHPATLKGEPVKYRKSVQVDVKR